ncbi:MAG: hypothetical protein ABI808_10155 [Pseudonocardiales bacterium]
MTQRHLRNIASATSGLVGCLLLAACGSSGSPTHAITTAPHSEGSAASSSAAPASTTATAVAASSSNAPTSAAKPAVADAAACSLITEQDVSTTVGNDPGTGSAISSAGATVCIYGSYPKPVLTVNALPTQGRADYDRARHNPSAIPVGGLGDQAFELSGAHTDVIYFTRGDMLIVIGFSTPASPPSGAALTLAKIAASRL